MAPSPAHSGAVLAVLLSAATFLQRTHAYQWTVQNPTQCGSVTLSITGGDAKPPFFALVIPFGPPVLPVEVRKLMALPFPNNQAQLTFSLPYPENSQFVVVISDATGFASGGTSAPALVLASDNSTCFDPNTQVPPSLYSFSIVPMNQIVQCVTTRIWWDPANVVGSPVFYGVIPGGDSFVIPQNQTGAGLTTVPEQGVGFAWKPSIQAGTALIIVGGDGRGNNTGGSAPNTISPGIPQDNSCLNDQSPSSTPGNPAGGSYQTGVVSGGRGGNHGGDGSGGSSSSNVGPIVGGVLGGLALIIGGILLFWFFKRRTRTQKRYKERPVDLINEDDEDEAGDERSGAHRGQGAGAVRRNDLPEYYQPEPFMVPDPTIADGASTMGGTQTGTDDLEGRRPMSGTTSSFYTRATTPDTAFGYGPGAGAASSGGERRKGGVRPMRAVNIIQHDDAGPSVPPPDKEGGEEEPETIELPPAYTAVKRAGAAEEESLVPATGTGTQRET